MSEKTKYLFLKSHPLFENISPKKILEACKHVKLNNFVSGEIFCCGEHCYSTIHLLIKGKLKIIISRDQDIDVIKDILTAPDIFGDFSLDGNFCADEFATALVNNTVVCTFDTVDFKRIIGANIRIALNYAAIVNKKLKKLESRHADLLLHDVKTRLLHFICNWAQTDGYPSGEKIILKNYLTHTDIAGVIATSRQSVNILLNEFKGAGLLNYNREHLELNDPAIWK